MVVVESRVRRGSRDRVGLSASSSVRQLSVLGKRLKVSDVTSVSRRRGINRGGPSARRSPEGDASSESDATAFASDARRLRPTSFEAANDDAHRLATFRKGELSSYKKILSTLSRALDVPRESVRACGQVRVCGEVRACGEVRVCHGRRTRGMDRLCRGSRTVGEVRMCTEGRAYDKGRTCNGVGCPESQAATTIRTAPRSNPPEGPRADRRSEPPPHRTRSVEKHERSPIPGGSRMMGRVRPRDACDRRAALFEHSALAFGRARARTPCGSIR